MTDIPLLESGHTLPAALIYSSAIIINADMFEVPSCMYIRAVDYTRENHFKDGFPTDYTFCSWDRWATIWGIPFTIKTLEYRIWSDFPEFIHTEISAFTNKNDRVQTMILVRVR